jgi:hypothetical protein
MEFLSNYFVGGCEACAMTAPVGCSVGNVDVRNIMIETIRVGKKIIVLLECLFSLLTKEHKIQ